jgi:hypothetical protein
MEREKVLNVSSESLASHLGEALACSTYPCLALFFHAKYNTRDKKYAGRKEFCLTIYPIRAEECRNRQFPPSRRGLALAEILSPTTTTSTPSTLSLRRQGHAHFHLARYRLFRSRPCPPPALLSARRHLTVDANSACHEPSRDQESVKTFSSQEAKSIRRTGNRLCRGSSRSSGFVLRFACVGSHRSYGLSLGRC